MYRPHNRCKILFSTVVKNILYGRHAMAAHTHFSVFTILCLSLLLFSSQYLCLSAWLSTTCPFNNPQYSAFSGFSGCHLSVQETKETPPVFLPQAAPCRNRVNKGLKETIPSPILLNDPCKLQQDRCILGHGRCIHGFNPVYTLSKRLGIVVQ
jgi:hypothetical protein